MSEIVNSSGRAGGGRKSREREYGEARAGQVPATGLSIVSATMIATTVATVG